MKTVAVMLMLAIGCLALSANATPVPNKTDTEIKKNTDIVTSRQAAPAVPPPATEDDDDDDDDDDDITDIAGDYEEEEEDEADGDDDEDEDYLERFIEDILGGDDDDDDDDDDEGTSSVVEASPPASPVQTQSAVPAGVQSDLNAAGEDSQVFVESVQAADINADSTGSYEEEEADAQPEGQAVSIEHSEPIVNPVIVHQVIQPVATQPADSDDDDDDDEDDDDDIDLDITGDEDSDEEEDDDEDDADEETDDEIEDITDIARSARAMESDTGDAIYVAKYNRFVDSILGRINKILKTNYDPVTVRLASPSAKSSKTKSKKKKKTKTKDKSNMKMTSRHAITNESTTPASIENQSITINKADTMTTTEEPISSRGFIVTTVKPKRVTVKNKINKISTKDTSNKNKNKTKQAKPSSKPRARATLYGLSSLKRSGDVSVNMMSDHTTIRTKFTLGPLILKVEKEFGRAAKKELKSATATTAEMSGKLSLRVLHGGAATLHSIRVLQPKQVRVDSPDDHDRTREFVWRRSSHIAHVVSQKLSSATRSMLRPPPQISK